MMAMDEDDPLAKISVAGMNPPQRLNTTDADSLLASVESARREATHRLDPLRRVLMGQFLT